MKSRNNVRLSILEYIRFSTITINSHLISLQGGDLVYDEKKEQEEVKEYVKERPLAAIFSIVLGILGFWFFIFAAEVGMAMCAAAVFLGYLGRGVVTPGRGGGNMGYFGMGIGLVGFMINFFITR